MVERRTRVSAYAVCRRDDRLLLVHQAAPGPAQDRWTLPGGGIDFGESPAAAVVREVREETGLTADVGDLLGVHDNVYDLGDGVLRHGVRLLFATAVEGELQATDAHADGESSAEIDGVAWFPVDDLPAGCTDWVRAAAGFAPPDVPSEAAPEGTGSTTTRLVLIRGNSGSGKSSIAAGLRASLPRGLVIVGQDQLRREILHVRDRPGNASIGLIDRTARYALDLGLDVVVEGILYPPDYAPMLRRLVADHRGLTRCYRLDVPFEETLRRHATKPVAEEYGEAEMRRWWADPAPVPGLDEQVITAESSLAESVARIRDDCGWSAVFAVGERREESPPDQH